MAITVYTPPTATRPARTPVRASAQFPPEGPAISAFRVAKWSRRRPRRRLQGALASSRPSSSPRRRAAVLGSRQIFDELRNRMKTERADLILLIHGYSAIS